MCPPFLQAFYPLIFNFSSFLDQSCVRCNTTIHFHWKDGPAPHSTATILEKLKDFFSKRLHNFFWEGAAFFKEKVKRIFVTVSDPLPACWPFQKICQNLFFLNIKKMGPCMAILRGRDLTRSLQYSRRGCFETSQTYLPAHCNSMKDLAYGPILWKQIP